MSGEKEPLQLQLWHSQLGHKVEETIHESRDEAELFMRHTNS